MTRASEQGLTPFDVECWQCGAQPKRPCTNEPPKVGPYHQDRKLACHSARLAAGEASPAVDVGALRRERDLLRDQLAEKGRALALLQRQHSTLIASVLAVASVPDARLAAERAYRAYQPVPAMPRAPMEMDDDLRLELSRSSAALHDGTH